MPFEIKRVYYIFDTLPNQKRGQHGHLVEEQFIVAMDGACQFTVDDGYTKQSFCLNRPDVGLYVGKRMWGEMSDFSYGCKLVVFSSTLYDENDYIKDYSKFMEVIKNDTSA